MKSLIEQTDELTDIIRQMHKIDSKMMVGQFIPAWRDLRRLLAIFEEDKRRLIQNAVQVQVQPRAKGNDNEE